MQKLIKVSFAKIKQYKQTTRYYIVQTKSIEKDFQACQQAVFLSHQLLFYHFPPISKHIIVFIHSSSWFGDIYLTNTNLPLSKLSEVCNNVEDMVSALKEKEVDGLLIDTYVAGARKELFSEYFRIRRIFDRKSAYGLVMAGDAMKLQKCFKKFISENRAMVYEEIRKVVETIEVGIYRSFFSIVINCSDITNGVYCFR